MCHSEMRDFWRKTKRIPKKQRLNARNARKYNWRSKFPLLANMKKAELNKYLCIYSHV